jgi:putative transposase
VLDRSFEAPAPNRKWIADFTYVWTAEGWLYVAAVVDLFSRRVVGWSMNADVVMLAITGGLAAAGLRLERVIQTRAPISILEASPERA